MPDIALEQKVITAAITIALLILYLCASHVHQHSTFNRSRAGSLLWGTDIRSRFSTNFRSYKKWVPNRKR